MITFGAQPDAQFVDHDGEACDERLVGGNTDCGHAQAVVVVCGSAERVVGESQMPTEEVFDQYGVAAASCVPASRRPVNASSSTPRRIQARWM
ncbi:hypothetical protein ACWEKM_13255 [Streptomyces sp. NPDC004752]